MFVSAAVYTLFPAERFAVTLPARFKTFPFLTARFHLEFYLFKTVKKVKGMNKGRDMLRVDFKLRRK
jgi:hypothetical protein